MLQSEQFQKVIRVFALAVLCNELQSNLMIPSAQTNTLHHTLPVGKDITYASMEDAKHHASIRLKALDKNFGEGHICSGALIAPSVVLTGAQCTFDDVNNIQRHPSELRVVMGTQNRYQRMQHTLVYSVTHLYTSTPSTFDSVLLHDNIAILMLERDIYEHSYIKPIPIRFDSTKKLVSNDVKATSWISTKEGFPVPFLLLLNSTITDQSQFDIGAPLLVDDELVGLISFGNERLMQNSSASVYIDVMQHHQWILEHIGDGTNQNSSIWGTTAFLLFTAFAFRNFCFKRRWYMSHESI